jgi:hypothetical protein
VDEIGIVWWVSSPGELPVSLAEAGPARPVGSAMGWQVWEMTVPRAVMDARLPELLRGRTVKAVACVEPGHSLEDLWWATEWGGALVVARRLAHQLWTAAELREGPWDIDPDELNGWDEPDPHGDPGHRELPLVLRPRRQRGAMIVTSPSAFRERLSSEVPTAIDVRVADVLERPGDWFGDLAGGPVGGAIALLSLSGARRPGDIVRLRNMTALGLLPVTSPDAIAEHVAADRITFHAVGGGEPPDRVRNHGDVHHHAPYRVYLEMEAPVDPEVEIEVGTIFEQASLNGVQTLATATPARVTVMPGYTSSLVIDAWCLDRDLSAPNGETLTVTGMRLGTAHQDQGAVWAERSARRRAE